VNYVRDTGAPTAISADSMFGDQHDDREDSSCTTGYILDQFDLLPKRGSWRAPVDRQSDEPAEF
jgi:hypothetical protein